MNARPESNLTDGLYYSERKLWDECPEARDVIERLGRCREELERLRDRNDTLLVDLELAVKNFYSGGADGD